VLYRRDLLSEIGGFDPTINATADWDLYLRIANATCIGAHNVAVVEYRLHDNNMSGNPATMLRQTLTLFHKHAAYVRGNKAREEAYRAGRNHCRSVYGQGLLNYIGHMVITRREWRTILSGIFILLRFNPGILTYMPFKKAIAALLIRYRLLAKQEHIPS
jgi:hypothetical protein